MVTCASDRVALAPPAGGYLSLLVVQAPSHQCEIEAIIALQTETVVVLRHGEIFLDKL